MKNAAVAESNRRRKGSHWASTENHVGHTGKKHSQKTKDDMSATRSGQSYHTEAQLEATREANRARAGIWHNPNPPTTKGKKIHSEEFKRDFGERMMEPEVRKRSLAAMHGGPSPNGIERELGKVLIEIDEDWRFVGDGNKRIGSKNPDFWDGLGRLIELFGDFWHRGQDGNERVAYFAERGYETLIIWESELGDRASLIAKIHSWLGEGGT